MEREDIEPGVDRAIDEMESDHGDMEESSEGLSDRVDAARNEWHARQADSQVPGARAPEEEPGDEAEEEPADDAEEESESAEASDGS